MVEVRRVFGQEQVTSVDSYLESVRRDESKKELVILVAGPEHYYNEMNLDGLEEDCLIRAFQPVSTDHEKVTCLDNLGGHSVTAFYQAGILIGFNRR